MARVVVIDSAEWILELLGGAITRAGHVVTTSSSAREGLDAVIGADPECIVCEVDLPDEGGYWVAQQVRAHNSRVSVAPFLFLSSQGDPEARLEGWKVGGDAHVTKPFRVGEVVAQVEALVRMTERLREGREALSSRPPAANAAISGQLAQVSVATLLSVLEIERRSGSFEVTRGDRHVALEIVRGFVVTASIDWVEVAPVEALRAMLGLARGRFTFTPKETFDLPPQAHRIARLLAASDVGQRGPVTLAPPKPMTSTPPDAIEEDGPIEVEPDLDSYRPPAR